MSDEKPLSERMREAAGIIAAVFRYDPWGLPESYPATEQALRKLADDYDRALEAAAERDELVDDVARQLFRSHEWSGCDGSDWSRLLPDSPIRQKYRNTAKYLLNTFDVRRIEVPF